MKHFVFLTFPQQLDRVSPYKDPVKNHDMKEFLNKVITFVFVFVFGILWFFSTKYYVKPTYYNIVIHDKHGSKFKSLEIRTKFTTQEVAYSYFKDYQKTYSNLKFSMESDVPKFKRRIFSLF